MAGERKREIELRERERVRENTEREKMPFFFHFKISRRRERESLVGVHEKNNTTKRKPRSFSSLIQNPSVPFFLL